MAPGLPPGSPQKSNPNCSPPLSDTSLYSPVMQASAGGIFQFEEWVLPGVLGLKEAWPAGLQVTGHFCHRRSTLRLSSHLQ